MQKKGCHQINSFISLFEGCIHAKNKDENQFIMITSQQLYECRRALMMAAFLVSAVMCKLDYHLHSISISEWVNEGACE